MKKKGLIISTIVMVVVLIASLTTATYAWFSTSASTKVDTISVNIDAASDIDLGVADYDKFGNSSSNNYKFGNTTFAGTGNTYTVSSGTTGLGSSLKLSAFNLGTAVASTNEVVADQTALRALVYASGVNATAFDPSKTIFAANINDGATDSEVGIAKMSDATIAVANTDYINLVLGARANKNDVSGIVAKITVKTTGDADTLMMDAALHLYLRTGVAGSTTPTKAKDIDVFGGEYETNKMSKDTPKGQVATNYAQTGVTYSVEEGQAVATIYVLVAGSESVSETKLTNTAIHPIQIYGYIWGPDADCVTNATGCSCTIDMEFISVNATNTGTGGSLNGITLLTLPAVA